MRGQTINAVDAGSELSWKTVDTRSRSLCTGTSFAGPRSVAPTRYFPESVCTVVIGVRYSVSVRYYVL